MKKKISFLIVVGVLACVAVCGVFINKSMLSAGALNANSIDMLCEEYTDTKTPNGVPLRFRPNVKSPQAPILVGLY